MPAVACRPANLQFRTLYTKYGSRFEPIVHGKERHGYSDSPRDRKPAVRERSAQQLRIREAMVDFCFERFQTRAHLPADYFFCDAAAAVFLMFSATALI